MNVSTESVDYRRSALPLLATPATVFDVVMVWPLVSVEHRQFTDEAAAGAYAECVRVGNPHLVVTVREF